MFHFVNYWAGTPALKVSPWISDQCGLYSEHFFFHAAQTNPKKTLF